jgi:hypothetical protein
VSSKSQLVGPLQEFVFSKLTERASLSDVTVLMRQPGQIQDAVDAAIAQLAVCLYVFPPLLLTANANNPGPYFDRIQIRVRCIENPVLNATGLDAYQLVELAHWSLNGQQPTNVDGVNPLAPDPNSTREIDDPQLVIFDVLYNTSGGLTPRPDSP